MTEPESESMKLKKEMDMFNQPKPKVVVQQMEEEKKTFVDEAKPKSSKDEVLMPKVLPVD